LDGLFRVFSLAEDFLQLGLVDDGLEVTDEVGEFGAKRSVDGYPDCFLDDAGNKDVCKGDALADEEGARREVGFEGVQGTGLAFNETSVCLD
jgi:hypothetical protein